jgi:protein-serine/threonine kinase
MGVKAGPAPPTVSDAQVHQPHGQSSPSVVTVDALTSQQAAAAKENKHVSSGAAKKVMDWFRRKSLAKETLSNIKTTQLRSDSTSSFVRISDGPSRGGAPHVVSDNNANAAMSSTSSFTRTAENTPLVAVSELPQTTTEPLQPPAEGSAKKTTSPSRNQLMLPPGAASAATKPTAPRSMSHNPVPATAPLPAVATFGAPKPTSRTPASNRPDESKMRVHDGFVDQSALSSKPPKVVMEEVLRVLQDMGMDVKRESEFRFRCTRVRRRKAGATTGLGLGSVMSVGSMGSFSLMGNASTSKVSLGSEGSRNLG